MKIPRDANAKELVKRLGKFGYRLVRQRGSHMTVRTAEHGGHTVWIPDSSPVAIGTLRNILGQVAAHFGLGVDELLEKLDL